MTSGRLLTEVSNAMVEDALLPAERALVEMGQQQRVRESRLFMKTATANRFIAEVERIVGRNVASFTSASDPDRGSCSSSASSSRSPTAAVPPPDARARHTPPEVISFPPG
jgi:hypothetical protein